jgi:hypothetical protein
MNRASVVPIRPGVIIAKGKRRSGFSRDTERVAWKFQQLIEARPAVACVIERMIDDLMLQPKTPWGA